jgi:hypothetical protein
VGSRGRAALRVRLGGSRVRISGIGFEIIKRDSKKALPGCASTGVASHSFLHTLSHTQPPTHTQTQTHTQTRTHTETHSHTDTYTHTPTPLHPFTPLPPSAIHPSSHRHTSCLSANPFVEGGEVAICFAPTYEFPTFIKLFWVPSPPQSCALARAGAQCCDCSSLGRVPQPAHFQIQYAHFLLYMILDTFVYICH